LPGFASSSFYAARRGCFCSAPCALAAEPAVSFRGKTIRIVVGASAGGGFDAYARLLAAHLGQHLAGAPSVIVQT
jgi:tripartite-type tricarboxylate transporter receptor subunit TctC